MGCAASRHGAVSSPSYDVSSCSYNMSRSASASADLHHGSSSALSSIWSRRPVRLDAVDDEDDSSDERRRRSGGEAAAAPVVRRSVAGEQAAAGWPSWLSSVAAEAVHGWVPLRAEGFEKLEKVGQGTYSSVFRARELATGRVVALKKVRFDSAEPESVRFMAREILILRRLRGHPNVVALEGLVASRSSSSLYLVFEYLQHDLAGLTSSADVALTEPQIKCFMRQLLEGLAHCHARGVMHRDIKCANLLVSGAGELKVADFGLANLVSSSSPPSQPLTSRVVTLWYRPPELLLGSTAYEPSVDLWSAGCVFAEMHARRPVLQGRTEVEQIHRIFKLCGSPPEEFWTSTALSPHAAVFRPHQQPYPSRLRETFAALGMPDHALRLLDTLLSLDPAGRGTAAAALEADYFTTEPYACEPGSMPRYDAPNKEMDAKLREEESWRRRRMASTTRHKSMQLLQDTSNTNQRSHVVYAEESLPDGESRRLLVDLEPVPAISKRHGDECARNIKEEPACAAGDRVPDLSGGPVQLAASTGFAWAKKPTGAATKRSSSKGPGTNSSHNHSNGGGDGAPKQEMIKQWAQVADAFSASEAYNTRFRHKLDAKQLKTGKVYKGKVNRVDFSGPLLSQPRRIDELLHSHEQKIRQAGRRSWFKKGINKEQH